MAFNTMIVRPNTDMQRLAAAIVARMKGQGHTVLECFGGIAAATALRVRACKHTGVGGGRGEAGGLLCACA
jgi:hypothetical protein